MAYYDKVKKYWMVRTPTPRPCEYNVGDELNLAGNIVNIVEISPCHGVSGPIGCLLEIEKELPEKYFKFIGFNLYFEPKIKFLGDTMNMIQDFNVNSPWWKTESTETAENYLYDIADSIIEKSQIKD